LVSKAVCLLCLLCLAWELLALVCPLPLEWRLPQVSVALPQPVRKSDPISDKINALLESVQKTMDKFETDIKPLFKQVPPPQALQGKLEGEELQIATGQASEALHRRYQSIEQRLNGLARTANPGPGIVEAFIQDLTAYEKDIKDYVEKA
jgi:hypothetical protein